MKKYVLLFDDFIQFGGRTLYRIKALRTFGLVRAGEIGGYIESEDNLSHEGECWVYDHAKVYENAHIQNNAKIFENAAVFGNAQILDDACICDHVWVYGNAQIHGEGHVCGNIHIYN